MNDKDHLAQAESGGRTEQKDATVERDLLAALEMLLMDFEDIAGSNGYEADWIAQRTTDAQAAIAKARGVGARATPSAPVDAPDTSPPNQQNAVSSREQGET